LSRDNRTANKALHLTAIPMRFSELPFWHTLYQTKYAEICRIKIKINVRAASVTNKSFERTTPSGLEPCRRESDEQLRSPIAHRLRLPLNFAVMPINIKENSKIGKYGIVPIFMNGKKE